MDKLKGEEHIQFPEQLYEPLPKAFTKRKYKDEIKLIKVDKVSTKRIMRLLIRDSATMLNYTKVKKELFIRLSKKDYSAGAHLDKLRRVMEAILTPRIAVCKTELVKRGYSAMQINKSIEKGVNLIHESQLPHYTEVDRIEDLRTFDITLDLTKCTIPLPNNVYSILRESREQKVHTQKNRKLEYIHSKLGYAIEWDYESHRILDDEEEVIYVSRESNQKYSPFDNGFTPIIITKRGEVNNRIILTDEIPTIKVRPRLKDEVWKGGSYTHVNDKLIYTLGNSNIPSWNRIQSDVVKTTRLCTRGEMTIEDFENQFK